MGKIANELAQKYNLNDSTEYQSAVNELHAIFDNKLIDEIDDKCPSIDFTKRSKTTNENSGGSICTS